MAGRNHLPPPNIARSHLPPHAALIEHPRPHHLLHRLPPPSSSAAAVRAHPALLEDRIEAQHREIQSLLLDNQRLAATHVALKQELVASQKEVRQLSVVADEIKAQSDGRVRDVYERARRVEAEVRSIGDLGAELAQVRADVERLTAERRGLAAELQAIDGDLDRARAELQDFPAIKAEIEAVQLEILRGRAAVEREKETCAANLEHDQAMDRLMISMAREIKKLQAELADAEKRARAAAAAAAAAAVAATPSPGYATGNGKSEVGYADPYAMHQVQVGAEAGSQHSSGPYVPYDMEGNHVHG